MSLLKSIIVAILLLEARLILRKYKPFVVAVTGSVGKTSTKDAIFTVLTSSKICTDQKMCYVRKSEKSMNSEIGLPLSIIGAPNAWHSLSGWLANIFKGLSLIVTRKEYPDCLVLEVGADHPGDIKKVAPWLRPDVAVITKVSSTPVHVEFFTSPEQVFEEKASLAREVKEGGVVVLYGDDDKTLSIRDMVATGNRSVITFGMSGSAEVRGIDEQVIYEEVGGMKSPVGSQFTLDIKGSQSPITIARGLGQGYIQTLLAAAAVGVARGMSSADIAKALNAYTVTPGRMNIIAGIAGSTIIDDTYNSSPDAALSALQALGQIETSGTKIAILGDMMELGKYATDEHRKIGVAAAGIVGRLVTVGQRSRWTTEEALKNGLSADKVSSFDTAEQALEYIKPLIQAGDVILVKGSQSVRMEKVSRALLRDADKAGELLVRQEKEWLEKR
ncbi:MAG: UDP-N-acetylmuramoyl-tripeptide--D-alanyl-D-alanine ligase [Patescibacteria group bacterium]